MANIDMTVTDDDKSYMI